MRQCPRCANQELLPLDVDGVTLDTCTACGGAYLDPGEIKALLDAAGKPLPAEFRKAARPLSQEVVRPDPTRKIACPGCGRTMREMNYAYKSNVLIDSCAACGGIWLDAGELLRLQAFAEAEREFMGKHGIAFASLAAEEGRKLHRKLDALEGKPRRPRPSAISPATLDLAMLRAVLRLIARLVLR